MDKYFNEMKRNILYNIIFAVVLLTIYLLLDYLKII